MNSIVYRLFGEGTELTAGQMAARAVVVFFLVLMMLRVSGRRSLGQHTALDACITVLLGSILARAVVGASPFWPTVASGVTLVLLHRAIAMLRVRVPKIDPLVNGTNLTLASEGRADSAAMRRGLISEADLLQALRENSVPDKLSMTERVVLERNGTITVLKR